MKSILEVRLGIRALSLNEPFSNLLRTTWSIVIGEPDEPWDRPVSDFAAQRPTSTESMVDTLAEQSEWLNFVVAQAHCIFWQAKVWANDNAVGQPPYVWNLRVTGEATARRILPVSFLPGEGFAEAWRRSIPPEDRARMDETSQRALGEGRRHYAQEFRCVLPTGEVRWMQEDVNVQRAEKGCWWLVGVCTDISDRKRAEMELRQAQKLESVGRLAAGIAHEINTPIQFVGDNTRFLQESFGQLLDVIHAYQELRSAALAGPGIEPGLVEAVSSAEEDADLEYLESEIPKSIEQTLEGVNRVSSIVRALKEFAHPDSRDQTLGDLNQALLSTLTVARNELKYVAEVTTDLAPLPPVRCYVGELNQVFLNLLINAAHAIADAGRTGLGQIRVQTRLEGEKVLIQISDSGCGIPEAIRHQVFDPFFTTKEVGRGTGQGLALARSVVVDKHHGSITFESEPGQGTTFTIALPVQGAAPQSAPRIDGLAH